MSIYEPEGVPETEVEYLQRERAYDLEQAFHEIDRLKQEVERLRKALGFYASKSRYQGANQRVLPWDAWTDKDAVYRLDVTRDNGDIARAALRTGG